jgi:hypothetical protein
MLFWKIWELRPERSGKITMNIDVDGRGFTEKYLNTAKGMSKIDFNDYTYTNVVVNGNFKRLITKDRSR